MTHLSIPDAAKKVPLMFRAQTSGRCQLQRIVKDTSEQDVERWASEWVEKAPKPYQFGGQVQTRSYTFNWRFVTNSGQDDGIIRPVIGAYGLPFYPGSSMKGLFRRACTLEQAQRYCGREVAGDLVPGVLRFHGGYPANDSWQENLVDIVHPQQDWQVKSDRKSSGAFAQVSLYKPTLEFGISSTIPLKEEWETVWQLWETALAMGIGCRVSAGYGQPQQLSGKVIYSAKLKGQGAASKLLSGIGEFRPNVFKAALRGHALRIFGGLTEAKTAERLVEELFGGVQGAGTVGLLAMTFQEESLELDSFGRDSYQTPTYQVKGKLSWLLVQEIPDKRQALQALLKALTRFAMLLGGFGKSWRRADHRLFYPEYYPNYDAGTGEDRKPRIGCHWEWAERSLINDVKVRKLSQVEPFIKSVCQAASDWMELQGITHNPKRYADSWREAWHPDKVQIWGRLAEHPEDSAAVDWLHRPYRRGDSRYGISTGSIYKTPVTGGVSRVGKLWHRMYPVVKLLKNRHDPQDIQTRQTNQYLELLTFFPDNSPEYNQFLTFLESEQQQFQKLWGN